ncbi:hypothetical protein MCOR25_005685 [Pyricularia grisea]|nr:hypothetical protein MCOR25_005685 [Pyricularia grisea]
MAIKALTAVQSTVECGSSDGGKFERLGVVACRQDAQDAMRIELGVRRDDGRHKRFGGFGRREVCADRKTVVSAVLIRPDSLDAIVLKFVKGKKGGLSERQ